MPFEDPLQGKDTKAGPMGVMHLPDGTLILIFASGKVVRIPPGDPPPPMREFARAANILTKAETLRSPATRVTLGRGARTLIASKLAEIQELTQRQVGAH